MEVKGKHNMNAQVGLGELYLYCLPDYLIESISSCESLISVVLEFPSSVSFSCAPECPHSFNGWQMPLIEFNIGICHFNFFAFWHVYYLWTVTHTMSTILHKQILRIYSKYFQNVLKIFEQG